MNHKSLAAAQLAVMKEVAYVQKKRDEKSQLKYTFAGEADLIAALRPVMLEHGIVGPIPIESKLIESNEYQTKTGGRMAAMLGTRKFLFRHVDSGETQEVETFAEAADTGDKRAAKAMTLAKKYALREFFNIETGDDPDEVVSERRSPNVEYFSVACTAIAGARSKEKIQMVLDRAEKSEVGEFTEEQLAKLRRLADETLSKNPNLPEKEPTVMS